MIRRSLSLTQLQTRNSRTTTSSSVNGTATTAFPAYAARRIARVSSTKNLMTSFLLLLLLTMHTVCLCRCFASLAYASVPFFLLGVSTRCERMSRGCSIRVFMAWWFAWLWGKRWPRTRSRDEDSVRMAAICFFLKIDSLAWYLPPLLHGWRGAPHKMLMILQFVFDSPV